MKEGGTLIERHAGERRRMRERERASGRQRRSEGRVTLNLCVLKEMQREEKQRRERRL